jgi:hypothetical protein
VAEPPTLATMGVTGHPHFGQKPLPWPVWGWFGHPLTEVPIRSFSKIDVPSMMKFETQGLKNKVVKTQGLKMCLTLNFKET